MLLVAQTALSEGQVFALALAGSLIPTLLWLWFFYTRDRFDREPKRTIAWLFLIGAFPVAIVAGIVNAIAAAFMGIVLTAVVVAPVGEELLKYAGARRGSRTPAFDEPVDGMVYGSTVGLGFAAAENVDYLMAAYLGTELWEGVDMGCEGFACFAMVAVIRGLGSALVHALCSGIAGYSLSRRVLEGAPRSAAVGGLSLAVLFHALWNATGLLIGFATLGIAAVVYTRRLRRALARSPHHGPQLLPHAGQWWFPTVPPPPPPTH